MRLILIRHGESSWKQERRIQGCRSDTTLNERGKAQAEKAALALREEKIAAIYSSPLKRAVSTAQALAQIYHLEVNIEPDLREIDAGELEGLCEEEVTSRYGEFWEMWQRGNGSTHLPGGESLEELQKRVWGAAQHLRKQYPDGVIVVFSHMFAILTLVCHVLGLDLSYMRRLRQDEAAITILEITPQGNTLLLLNDTCHLEAKQIGSVANHGHR